MSTIETKEDTPAEEATKLQNIRFVNNSIDIGYVFLDKTTAIEASLIKAENSHKTTCFVDKYRNADFFIGKGPGNLPPALDATKLYEYYLMNEWLKYIAVDEIEPQTIDTGFIQLLKKDDGPYLPLFNRKYQTTGFTDPNALYDMDFTSFYDVQDNKKITWNELIERTLSDDKEAEKKEAVKNDVGFDIKIKGGKRDKEATKKSFDWADSISGFYKLSMLIMDEQKFIQKIGLWDEKCSVCDTETISEYSTIHTHYDIPVDRAYMCDMDEKRGGIWTDIKNGNGYANPLELLYNLIACKFIRRICAIIYNKKLTPTAKTAISTKQESNWNDNLDIDANKFVKFLKNLGDSNNYGFNDTEGKKTSLGRCKSLYNKFKGIGDGVVEQLDLGNYGDAPQELITKVIGVLKSTKNGKTFKKTYEDFNKKINALIKGNQDGNYLIKVTPKGLARTPQMSFPFALKDDGKANKRTDFTLTFPKSASALSKSRGGNTLKKLSSTFNSALLKWVKEDQSRKEAFEKWAKACKKKSTTTGNKAFNYNITNKQQLSNISCIRWLKSMYKDDEEEDENILIKIARKEYEKLFEDKPNTNDKYTLTDILDELTKKDKPHLGGGVYMRGGGDKDDYIINMIGLLAWSIVNVELKPKQGGQFTENEYRNTSILQLAIENVVLNKVYTEITVSQDENNNDIYTLINRYNNMIDNLNLKKEEGRKIEAERVKAKKKAEKSGKNALTPSGKSTWGRARRFGSPHSYAWSTASPAQRLQIIAERRKERIEEIETLKKQKEEFERMRPGENIIFDKTPTKTPTKTRRRRIPNTHGGRRTKRKNRRKKKKRTKRKKRK